MTDAVSHLITTAATLPVKGAGKVTQVAQLETSAQRFSGSLATAIDGAAPAAKAAAAQARPAVQQVQQAQAADANERARRALQLDGQKTVTPVGGGDTILDGLQKLRTIFDKQQAKVNEAVAAPITDMKTLLAVQMETVNYSVLVDVTSKLTGKSTQAFESLLKGQ